MESLAWNFITHLYSPPHEHQIPGQNFYHLQPQVSNGLTPNFYVFNGIITLSATSSKRKIVIRFFRELHFLPSIIFSFALNGNKCGKTSRRRGENNDVRRLKFYEKNACKGVMLTISFVIIKQVNGFCAERSRKFSVGFKGTLCFSFCLFPGRYFFHRRACYFLRAIALVMAVIMCNVAKPVANISNSNSRIILLVLLAGIARFYLLPALGWEKRDFLWWKKYKDWIQFGFWRSSRDLQEKTQESRTRKFLK